MSESPTEAREQSSRRVIPPSVQALGAFLLYLVAAIVLWGLPVLTHFTTRYVGVGHGDAPYFRWAFGWTPWALSHGHNPIFSDRVYAPAGASLSWSTFIPGPAFVLWPVTRLFGTLASYNLSLLLAPPLAAWAAYLVCRRVTRSFWPSLMGGYLFGFATFMVGQIGGHANLVLVFPVPLAVYLVIRRVEGSMRPWLFVALLALSLLGLFSISPEVFATAAMFGGVAVLIGFIFAKGLRGRLAATVGLMAIAYAIVVAVVFVPFLLPMVRNAPSHTVRPNDRASADLLGFVVPRSGDLLGGQRFATVADRFTANADEDASYVSVALVVMLLAFAITERRRRATWALLAFVLAVSIFALGPVLHVAGRAGVWLPGALLGHVPLLRNAAPQRFPMYSALGIGVVAAIWLARAKGRWAWARWGVVLLGAVLLLPTTPNPPWHIADTTPPFITTGAFRSVLRPDEIVLVIPKIYHEDMGWQASANFAFRMPGGYLGVVVPKEYSNEPLDKGIALVQPGQRGIPRPQALAAWLTQHEVTAVAVADAARPRYEPLLRSIGLRPVYVGEGVSVWRSPTGRYVTGR